MALIYGFCNCATFNIRPEGDEQWFSTRAARDEALRQARERAVSRGLSASAAQAGIYPIKGRARAGVELRDLEA